MKSVPVKPEQGLIKWKWGSLEPRRTIIISFQETNLVIVFISREFPSLVFGQDLIFPLIDESLLVTEKEELQAWKDGQAYEMWKGKEFEQRQAASSPRKQKNLHIFSHFLFLHPLASCSMTLLVKNTEIQRPEFKSSIYNGV